MPGELSAQKGAPRKRRVDADPLEPVILCWVAMNRPVAPRAISARWSFTLALVASAIGCAPANSPPPISPDDVPLPSPSASAPPQHPPGVHVVIQQVNDISRMERLVRAVYKLDGRPILARDDERMANQPTFPVFEGWLPDASHTIEVELAYEPYDPPPFGFDEPARFHNRHPFSLAGPRPPQLIRVVMYEREKPPGPVTSRLELRYEDIIDDGP
jgi:hypothetical protein